MAVLVLLLWAALGPGPAAAQMAHQVDIGTDGDDFQANLGTPGRDFILQDGRGGNDTQHIGSAEGDDWLEQNGGDGNDSMNVLAGDGNDFIHQDGGSGNDNLYTDGALGNDWIIQLGGPGDDNVSAIGGEGNNLIYQSGGPGNDTMQVDGLTGGELVRLDGGEGNDTLTYAVSSGESVVYILGGPGSDTLTVHGGSKNFTLVTENGQVLCSQGPEGSGSYIIVGGVEVITVRGPEGTPICQPDMSSPSPTPAPITTWWGTHEVVTGTDGDDTLTTLGTEDRNFIKQDGLGGNDTMYIAGGDGDNWLEQNGGDGNDNMTIQGGIGNDFIHQVGGSGNNIMTADGGDGNDIIFQFGGPGQDNITATGGVGNDLIYQSGGPGNDTMLVDGGEGDDIVRMDGGEGDDTLTYNVSAGLDTVYIDGGPGYDTLTVYAGVFSYTLVNEYGQVLCQQGMGGTYIIVRNVEEITVLGSEGQAVCEWPILANFTADYTEGMAPLTVKFTDTSFGMIAAWAWDFGDGKSSTEQNPSHLYKKAGTYQVTLTVTGPAGNSSGSATIKVYKKGAPKPNFSVSAKSGSAPLTVQFSDLSTGWITDWLWDFGDPDSGPHNHSASPNSSHTYDAAGKYKATLPSPAPGDP